MRTRGAIQQMAWVVEDLDASIQRWMTQHGVGPWTVFRSTTLQGRCRGTDTAVKMHVGLSYQGDLQIELIQPVSHTPSPYQDAQGRKLIGMHHVAWHSAALDADVAEAKARGMHPVFEASNGAVRVAYLESPEEPGVLFEFIEAVPVVLEGFAAGLQASKNWDGRSTPVTTFDFEA